MAIENAGQNTTDTSGTTLDSGASVNLKGSYVELVSSTGINCEWMYIQLKGDTSGSLQYNVDIAIGAVSSEVVIIEDIVFFEKDGRYSESIIVPIQISSGSRVSARSSDNSSSARQVDIIISFSDDDGFGTCSNIDTIGVSSGKGVIIDPGATINTQGSYTELVASSANTYNWFVIMINYNVNGTQTDNSRWLIELATGATSSEVPLVEGIIVSTSAAECGSSRFRVIQATI